MQETKSAADLSVDAAAKGLLDTVLAGEYPENQPDQEAGGGEGVQEPEATGDQPDETDFDDEAVDALSPDEEETDEDPEDAEDESVEEPEAPKPESYTVKADGEELEVTLDELKAGYSRTASWTRKSQKLAEERKSFEQEQAGVREERAKYAEMLGVMEQQLQASMPEEPKTNDPQEWIRYQRAKGEADRVRAEQAKLQQAMRADWEAERARLTAQEDEKLVGHFPEWRDPTVALAAKADLVAYATGLGFELDELSNVYDHRIVLLLSKAKAYEDLMAQQNVVREKTKNTPTLKPGQPKGRAKTSAKRKSRSQRDKLRESGRVDDAAALIFEKLGD